MLSEEKIVKFVRTDSANRIKRGDGRLYHVSLYLLAWIVIIACSWSVEFHFIEIFTIRKPLSVVLEIICIAAFGLLTVAVLCFNRMNQRWYLYTALISASINLVISAIALCFAYYIKQTTIVIILYAGLTIIVSNSVVRRTIHQMEEERNEEGNGNVPVSMLGGIGASLGILLGNIVSENAVPFALMLLSAALVHITVMFASIYSCARKCTIPSEMWFNEKYATIKDSNEKDM